MSKFQLAKKSNPCPVCGNTTGKCRTKDDEGKLFTLCMTESGASKFEVINGWKCVKVAGSSQWATFAIANDKPQTAEEKAERRRTRKEREAEEKQRYQAGLSAAERHQVHKQLLEQLTLHPADRADLERRGLSAEVIATFRSTEPWQPLSHPVNSKAPCVADNGLSLRTPHCGCLVPAKDIQGNILGFQIRNRFQAKDSPKYAWLSARNSKPVHLKNGELPITFAGKPTKDIHLSEGTLKPLVAAERHNMAIIGASGGNFASSPQELKRYLSELTPERIILCPDAGDAINRQVMRRHANTAELLEQWGYSLQVRWWGQKDKTAGDIDEISQDRFKKSNLISWEKFQAISAKALKQVDEANQKTTEQEQIRHEADQWEMIPPNVDWLDTQYFGDALLDRVQAADSTRHLLSVYGATGNGKTQALKALRRWAYSQNKQFIYLTVKENLARAAANDLGLAYRLDLEEGNHGPYPDLAGCAASLIDNARGITWEKQVSSNAIVALDEIDLFMKVAAGSDAGSNALELQQILTKVLQSAQTIIIMSAQVKSRHINLIEQVSEVKTSEIIGILKAAIPKRINLCDNTQRSDDETELEGENHSTLPIPSMSKWLIDRWAESIQSGETSLLLTGAQKPDSKLGTMLLEPFALEHCEAESVLRLDSQSTKDPTNRAFKIAEQPYTKVIQQHQCTIGSPSCQEGFSLHFGDHSHFDKVFAFDPGSKLPEQIIQDIGRDRHNTETWVSVSAGHRQRRFGGTTDPLEISRIVQAMANQPESKMVDTALSNSPHNWDSKFFRFYCEDIAQANAALADKVYNLQRYLTAVGHSVEVLTLSSGVSAVGIPDDFYDRIAGEYHQAVADSRRYSRFDVEEIQNQGKIELAQWYGIQQFQFRQAMAWDVTKTVNPETGAVEHLETPLVHGLEIDADFVRQWSRDRVAKPWQMHFYAQYNPWDWFAHDLAKHQGKPKFEQIDLHGNITADFAPNDILSLKSRKLSLLAELGMIDFMKTWSVDVASEQIKEATDTKTLTRILHEKHREMRFTKANLKPIVEKLVPRFDEVCALLDIKSQRNKDGDINHRQVLTILRNAFQVKTFAITNASLNGVRGVYVLVADDKAQALRAGLLKAEHQKDDNAAQFIEKARERYTHTHRRIEMHSVWAKRLEVEQAALRKFLEQFAYKKDLLEQQKPKHWPSLQNYLSPIDPATEACAKQLATVRTYTGYELCFINHGTVMADQEKFSEALALLPKEKQLKICELLNQQQLVTTHG